MLWRSTEAAGLSWCTLLVVWHGAHLAWNWVTIVIEGRRGRWHSGPHSLTAICIAASSTIVAIVRGRGTKSATLTIVWLLLLVLIELTLALLLGTSPRVLTGLSFLSSVAEPNLSRQDKGALHSVNALLGCLLATEFNEAKALRVLSDRVHYNLGIEARWEILLEGSKEHLVVNIWVQISHINL
jgi:hypothetical protein